MSIRSTLGCAVLLAALAAPALAKEGNPVGGVGVSVETSPGGIMMPSADCKLPKGSLVKVGSKWTCKLAGPATMTGNPVGGIGVSVEQSGAGLKKAAVKLKAAQ